MFEGEEWVPIQELPHYIISTHGRVKHTNRLEARTPTMSDKGFPIIMLYGADGKTRNVRHINKLVALAFLPPPTYFDEYEERNYPKTAVWHIDGDLANCHFENLRWEARSKVLEWNNMHRNRTPKYVTPPVRNNRTGVVYENAFECAMAEGVLESNILWRVESQAQHLYDESAKYMYV